MHGNDPLPLAIAAPKQRGFLNRKVRRVSQRKEEYQPQINADRHRYMSCQSMQRYLIDSSAAVEKTDSPRRTQRTRRKKCHAERSRSILPVTPNVADGALGLHI